MGPKKTLFIILWISLTALSAFALDRDAGEKAGGLTPLDEETARVTATGMELWWAFYNTLAGGNPREINAAFRALYNWQTTYGYDGLPALSSALIYTADSIVNTPGQKDQTEFLFEKSLRLDPLIPDNYFTQAKISIKKFHFFRSLSALLKGISASWRNISGRYYLISSLLFLWVHVFFLIGAVTASIFLFKYYACLKHDIQELFLKSNSTQFITFFIWIILFLPLLIGGGMIWTMALWLVLSYKYMRKRERLLTVVLLVLGCLINPLYDLTLCFYRNYPASQTRIAFGMIRNGYNPVLIDQIETALHNSPEDNQNRFFLASLYQQGGKYNEALTQYRDILKNDPSRFDIFLNIGNIYHLTRQNSLAIENYNRSIELNPSYAPAYYNASLTYAKQFNFEKAAEYKKEALKYDESILRYAEESRIFMNSPTREMIHERIGKQIHEDFLSAPYRMPEEGEAQAAGFLFMGSRTVIPGVFLLLFLMVLTLVRKDRPCARFCRKCGSVYCRKCQSFTGMDEFCSQCHHLFVKRDGIAPAAKKFKMEKIRDYRKNRRLAISFLTAFIPGSSHLYLGSVLAGFLMITIWAFSILYIVFESVLLKSPLQALDGGMSCIAAAFVFLLVLLYLVANLSIHTRKLNE